MVAKSIWGPAVWYLFHTLAFKIKNDKLVEYYQILSNRLHKGGY